MIFFLLSGIINGRLFSLLAKACRLTQKLPKVVGNDTISQREEAVTIGKPKKKDISEEQKQRLRPASTPEARENQLISLAVDLAEKQLMEGTASSQVITHYLKLGSTRQQLEKERLERENELLRAKTEALESAKHVEELYANALNAMRNYSGQSYEEFDDVDNDDY